MRPAAFELVTAPSSEPITRAEAKAHARVAHDAEDALFDRFIAAARRWVEHATGLALVTQTWKATFDSWPSEGLALRPHPVAALVHVKAWDGTALTAQTLANFQLLPGRPARVAMGDGFSPPIPARSRSGIEVQFTAGYGAASAVPEDLKQAMLLLVAHWYDNREPTTVSQNLAVAGQISHTIAALITPHRNLRIS